MRVRSLAFDKAHLAQAPADHRIAFLGLSQLANEAAVLLKMALGGINALEDQQVVRDAANATAMLATRMLAGRLWEARQFVNTREVATALREIQAETQGHIAELDQSLATARLARTALFAAMENGGLIERLRNQSSFHVSVELLTASFDRLPDDVGLMDHLAASRGNSIYGAAEALHLTALGHILDEPDFTVALDTAISQIGETVGHLGDFVDGFMFGFTILHFGGLEIGPWVDVPAAPLDQFRSPLFMDPPQDAEAER